MNIECPKCGNVCSDKERRCLRCGESLVPATPSKMVNLSQNQAKKMRVIIMALCGAVAILGTVLILFLIFKNDNNTRTRPEIEEDRGYYNNNNASYNHNYNTNQGRSHRTGNEVIVYSKSSDGFLNIRETPSSKGRILGKLRNGPQGAVYLGQSGSWTEVECNGVVGYVYTKYLSYTPTVAVTVDIDIKWLTGPWYPYSKEYAYLIFNNGTYAVQYYYGTIAYGTYKLEYDEIVFSAQMVRSGLGFPVSSYERFKINVSPKRIGNMTKRSLVKEDDLWRYSGELVWTYAQFKEIQKDTKRYLGK